MKKAVILGLGVSGKAAARLLSQCGYDLYGIDSKVTSIEEPVTVVSSAQGLNFDLAVVSPGIPPSDPDYRQLMNTGIELIGEAELGCRHLRSKAVAITGTNGKTTVTSLVAHVMRAMGRPAEAIGNIGLPICDFVLQADHHQKIALVELSSYQLETLETRAFSAGALLNITPDHLDRYPSFEAYASAKWHLEKCLKQNSPFYVDRETYDKWAPILGEVDAELFSGQNHLEKNFTAAEKLCSSLGIDGDDFYKHAATFKTLQHRIELVEIIDEVQWIDDSKGTNVDAVIQAVKIVPAPIVLIAGGVDKGSSYLPWIQGFNEKVHHICAIGEAASKIYNEINDTIPVTIYDTMEQAVAAAADYAIAGGAVLLSPGCSSFDMFRDYHHRGEMFKAFVREYKERCTR